MTILNERANARRVPTGVMINVLGGIGAGKSSLAHALADEVISDCIGLYEPASKTNPYLADYYADIQRWSFTIQVFLLNRRLEQQRYAQDACLAGHNIVQDSSIFSDSCFVNMLEKTGGIDVRDADTYFELFQNMSRDIMYPTAVVYLDTDPEVQLARIAKRMEEKEGRKCEVGIDIQYLKDLHCELEVLLSGLQRYTHVLRIPWNDDLTHEQIVERGRAIYQDILALRRAEPIRCFMGL